MKHQDNPFNCPKCKEHKHITAVPGNKIRCNTCKSQFHRDRSKEKIFIEYVEKHGYPKKI